MHTGGCLTRDSSWGWGCSLFYRALPSGSHGDLGPGVVSVPAPLEYHAAGPLSTSLLQEGLAPWYGKCVLVAPWGKTIHNNVPAWQNK